MAAKSLLALCASVLIVKIASAQYNFGSLGSYNTGLPPCAEINVGVLDVNNVGIGVGLPFGGVGSSSLISGLGAANVGYAGLGAGNLAGLGAGLSGITLNGLPNGLAASSGGSFPVTSVSPLAPTGISVLSENVIEGPVVVTGQLPFLSTVTLEGQVPAGGAAGVQYSCGDGAVGIISEGVGAGVGLPGYGYGAGLGLANAGLAGLSLAGSGVGLGCGCGAIY